jgi:hypothetical protein
MDESLRKRSLWIFGIIGFFAAVSAFSYFEDELYVYLIAYLWFGLVYGMCLQYGRFCFSSAFRDLFAIGVPRMVVGIMIATILFSLVATLITSSGMSTFHPAPVSIHSVIAGMVFGIGMVLAGGCASGSLYKTGEGNMNAALVVLSISITQALFVDVGGWANWFVPKSWAESAASKNLPESITATDGWVDQYLAGYVWNQPVTTFAEMMGMENASLKGAMVGDFLFGVVIPATLLLVVVYYIWSRKSYLKKLVKKKGSPATFKDNLYGFWAMVISSRRTAIAGLFLGIACGLHMLVMQGLRMKFNINNAGEILQKVGWDYGISVNGTVFDPGYWYVTTQEAQWVGWAMQKLGSEKMDNIYFGLANGIPNPLFNPADWMSIALIGGAAIMALVANEFRFKKPTRELAVWAILGGFFMGIGSRLGLGCNIGAFFVRVANGDPSGWMFGIGMIGGAFIGVKFFNWWTERQMAKEMAAFDI